MCGIAGILNFNQVPVQSSQLKRMTDQMIHRGPDDYGYITSAWQGIAMRRLSIIDVEGGHQPIANEDGSVAVVVNGEIYNYLELKDDLVGQGHMFKTNSDTEVLVHLYEEYGKNMVHKLNGMYAFIIWDRLHQLFWVVRDRLGIKPLYFYKDDKRFACASDLSALRAGLPSQAEISREAFLSYLALGYVGTGDSIYRGVQKLLPGHWLEIDCAGFRQQKYWDIDDQTSRDISAEEAQEELLFLLQDAVRLQERSDVPVGTFLSGGMDSSAVVALLAEQSQQPVRTLTVDFQGKDCAEGPFAQLVVSRYRTLHSEKVLTYEKMGSILEELIGYMDEPVADSAVIPSYYLSKIAKDSGIKVLLNGTGGDEIFGGYNRYHPNFSKSKYELLRHLPLCLRKGLGRMIGLRDYHLGCVVQEESLCYAAPISGVDLGLLRQTLRRKEDFSCCCDVMKDLYGPLFEEDSRMYYGRMLHDLRHYLVGDVLSLLDKTTMACSIEGRVPLLDHRIVEFAYSLPENVNILDGQPKGLFKKTMRTRLPSEIVTRSKLGFNAPVDAWMNDFLRCRDGQMLADAYDVLSEYFVVDELQRVLQKRDGSFSSRSAETLFSLFVFYRWHKRVYEQ